MEPMMPEDCRELADKTVDLIKKSSSFAGMLNADVALAVGDLVRSMNCYYSNFIEGHDTHPRDIERALREDFDSSEDKRDLQKEAKAHIEVQGLIDKGEAPHKAFSKAFALWTHKEFCERLPESMLWVKNPDTDEMLPVIPGRFRETSIQVGRHIAPRHEDLDKLLVRFEEAYDPVLHSRVRQVISVAAAHHRFVWIHPFNDGNGRVTRLMSHAYLKQLGIGSSLWSVSRGLAKRASDYKQLLQAADEPRHDALDGRGALSERSLTKFCEFFLDVCIDQVDFMNSRLELKGLQLRIERYCAHETDAKCLLPGSWNLLREALLSGEFNRGKAAALTGKGSVQARKVLAKLIEKRLLVSDTPKGAVRLGFPLDVLDQWMPGLYQ
jgi:Fic family protein